MLNDVRKTTTLPREVRSAFLRYRGGDSLFGAGMNRHGRARVT